MLCPCGSARDLSACCGPLHQGWASARTALELMRSRFAAYATGEVQYLIDTHDPAHPPVRRDIESWIRRARFVGLEIVDTEAGGEQDAEGVVEFLARYVEGGVERVHLERSRFVRRDGRWLYSEATPSRARAGRNDPCPCGSGKKFKKCCGA